MPKIVDHEQRREEILEATRRVILKQGLSGVTMRSIAGEIGKSTGLVNHYFEDKSDLLVAAFEASHEQFNRQVHEHAADKAPGRASVRALLQAALPRDDDDRVYWILWFGSGKHAPWGRRDDAVRAIQHAPYKDWHRLIRNNFDTAVEKGEFQLGLDARSEVSRLIAIVVGLGVESAFLGVTRPRSELMRLVDDQLATLDS